ncbi:UDP-N-acetylmuramate dehydrogenase [Candidatus Nomurabacteria bacterium]|nr:UDP-N-acetylmuramate dehydrogenase [Candidatus Nomurabacteria bacterium]
MKIENNYNLSKLNTFGISVNAKFFVEIQSEEDLQELFKMEEFFAKDRSASGGKNNQKLFLGGGSNVLFIRDFNGLVILNKLKGITILNEDSETVTVRCMGGEIWHDLVNFTVERGLWGIENLSLIPGTVGAAPMQNIGAYGAELQNVLLNVEAFDISTQENKKKRIFFKEECHFGYRDSIFKNELKNKYFITAISLKLSKTPKPNISYKILTEYLDKNKIEVKNSKDVSDAVAFIRRTKLPDPTIIPNAGSFFKNVFLKGEVGEVKMKELLKIYPEMPYFKEENGSKTSVLIKIPAAWLIEQCGWKGKRVGNVGVHDKQALVLVNYGGATGEEILVLANTIIKEVREKFNLELSPEVNMI